MNKWQIEVQQSLLDSEEATIKELEKQYAAALKGINDKVKLFQADIDLLDQALSQDGLDDATKAHLQSLKRSKIYQQNYQKALKGQVSGILDKMHGDNYATIDKYLHGCYETGFIGTMYDIAGQNIPLIIPIDQAAAVKAILTDSKVSNGLYTALGVDVAKLKKTITQEISRGIASGLPYRDIARNIKGVSGAPLSRAKTIARTEGHRIQQTSSRDAQYAAKKKGCDVVKQWDAALDGRTRDSHRMVDGEIKELDEEFSNGLMFPGDPSGGAAEVVNCRCTANTRARWALDEEELNTLKDRAAYFGLDKTKNFEEYKEKYLTAAEAPIVQNAAFTPAKTVEEAQKYAKDILGLSQTTAYSLGLNVDVANGVNEAVYRINGTFKSLTKNGYLENILLSTNKTGAYAMYSPSLSSVFLNPVAKQKSAIKKMAKDAAEEFAAGSWSTGSPFHSVYHELGHAVQHMLLDKDAIRKNKIDVLYSKTFSDIMGSETWSISNKDAITKGCAGAKNVGFSYYGLRNSGEFVAESVAQYFLSNNPSEIAKKVVEILKGG